MSGLNRNNNEKYYTNSEVSKQCIDFFMSIVKPDINDIIIEPSAGSGSFSDHLRDIFPNLFCYDLYPEKSYILKQNYLEFTMSECVAEPVHVIGNPPFGRQSSLVRKFIKKSMEFASSISFILPRSFKKQSMQKAFSLDFHLEFEIDLPKNSFSLNGEVHDVPCIFQIWKKYTHLRQVVPPSKPDSFNFVKKTNLDIDFSITRVGGCAGRLNEEYESCSASSNYFIKLNDTIDKNKFKEMYKTIQFLDNNTVGPKSISKSELINFGF